MDSSIINICKFMMAEFKERMENEEPDSSSYSYFLGAYSAYKYLLSFFSGDE